MISCALIGLGRIASLLEDDARREKPASHAGAIAAHPGTVIAAGMDIDPERRQFFGERWGVGELYEDAAEMIHQVRPGILHICTHADSHLEYLVLAMEEAVPVVVLEKPVSDSLRKAVRAGRLLEKSTTRVVVNHERRYSGDYLAARQKIRSGSFGAVRSVSARLYMGRERPVEAVLLYDGTHLFDIIAFLLNAPVRDVRGCGGGRGARTLFASAVCGGVPVLAEIGSGRDHVVFELDISCERGRLRIGNGLYEEWESGESPYYENMKSLGCMKNGFAAPTGYFAGMFADAVRLFHDPGTRAVSAYGDGLESLYLVDMIRRRFRLKF